MATWVPTFGDFCTTCLIGALFYLLYKYGMRNYHIFSDLGIPGPKPLPFIGNIIGFMTQNPIKHDAEQIRKYGKVFGIFEGALPELFIADADLIRLVFVKEYENFINRRNFEFQRDLHRKMITILRDQEWKDVRLAIGQAMTTSKVRKMFGLMQRCADRLVDDFTEKAKTEGKFDVRTACFVYPLDVIARCAFGANIENLGKKDDVFMRNAKVASSSFTRSPLMILPSLMPSIARFLRNIHFKIPEFDFFVAMLNDLIKERKTKKIVCQDFVDMATEALSKAVREENGKKVPLWSPEQVDQIVISQCAVFIFAGLESVSTALGAACYLLATHPDIQEKLHKMVVDKLEQYESISPEMLLDLPYADYIAKEALRLYSPAARVERECNQDITYNGIQIKKGMLVRIPIYSVHYSEEYFPEPEKFDPDRWDPANKDRTNPYAFVPFGIGPRNCVGMKFSFEEIKIALCNVVHKFRFFPIKETPAKLEMNFGFYNGNNPTSTMIGIELRQS
nr:CYP360A6 protein [Diaphanosoma celebensis]